MKKMCKGRKEGNGRIKRKESEGREMWK